MDRCKCKIIDLQECFDIKDMQNVLAENHVPFLSDTGQKNEEDFFPELSIDEEEEEDDDDDGIIESITRGVFRFFDKEQECCGELGGEKGGEQIAGEYPPLSLALQSGNRCQQSK